jgi:hypothetical protein
MTLLERYDGMSLEELERDLKFDGTPDDVERAKRVFYIGLSGRFKDKRICRGFCGYCKEMTWVTYRAVIDLLVENMKGGIHEEG